MIKLPKNNFLAFMSTVFTTQKTLTTSQNLKSETVHMIFDKIIHSTVNTLLSAYLTGIYGGVIQLLFTEPG